MNIETAANIGEAVSGIAILFTLLFSLRQIKYWNANRRYEIGRDLANHMNNPLVHRGFAVSTTKLHDELTPQELAALSREEKDAMNAMMIGFNNIGVLAKNGHLSLDLVEDFCGVYVRVFASRWRRVIEIFMMVNMSQNDEAIDGVWAGLFWLLDTFENNPEKSEISENQK
tara:strand:- start:1280 stop:1792 length:513 start_codon:yes stop_codon:yes gene_type:complete